MKRTTEPQDWAIEVAIKNGERDMPHYDIFTHGVDEYTVRHKTDKTRSYTVTLTDSGAECDCPFCQVNGVCKHGYILSENLRIREMEKRQAQEVEYRAEVMDTLERRYR